MQCALKGEQYVDSDFTPDESSVYRIKINVPGAVIQPLDKK